jgi:tetratricopeptide (TPR) repeat protein
MSFQLYSRSLGRLDESLILAQRGHKADPGNFGALVIEYFNRLSLDDDRSAQTVYQQMEDLDAANAWLPYAKAWLNIKNSQLAAAREQARFLQKNFADPQSQWLAGILFAATGDDNQAREAFLSVDPRYLDRARWSDILNGGAEDVCAVGLTLMRTGDESLGRELVSYAANYWEQTAPLYMQHADRWPSFACHAYLGDIDKSLAALETAFNHKHVFWYWVFMANDPRLSLLHEDPRFQAMDQKVRAELARQRENLARIEMEAST